MRDPQTIRAILAEIDRGWSIGASPHTLRTFIESLVAAWGGRFWQECGTYKLRLAGVTVSSTAGEYALLSAWLRRAAAAAQEGEAK